MSADDDDLAAAWRAAPTVDAGGLTLDAVKARSTGFRRTIAFRNAREYAAAVLVVAIFGEMATDTGSVLRRVACALIVAGTFYVVFRLRRDGRAPTPLAPDATALEHMAHLRHEMVRQRDLLRGIFAWYLLPFVPGAVLFFVATGIEVARRTGGALFPMLVLAGAVAISAAVFAGIYALNRVGAKRLDRQIEALETPQVSQAMVTPSPPSPG
jgi:hypothetical protein